MIIYIYEQNKNINIQNGINIVNQTQFTQFCCLQSDNNEYLCQYLQYSFVHFLRTYCNFQPNIIFINKQSTCKTC